MKKNKSIDPWRKAYLKSQMEICTLINYYNQVERDLIDRSIGFGCHRCSKILASNMPKAKPVKRGKAK